MMELYCIDHETIEVAQTLFQTLIVDNGKDEKAIPIAYVHKVIIPGTRETPAELDWCDFGGGWATCPPPELKPDWIERVTEPSREEMKTINNNAKFLAEDFLWKA